MTPEVEEDRELQNENAYDDLVGAIEASDGILSLLIAVCDDGGLREKIITRYEAELQSQMRCYRLPIIRGEPSLRQTIAQAVQGDEYLQQGGRAVFTVIGAEQLFFLRLGQERSEQEIFFGYLQWTREGLREFPYPIVLWVTNQLLKELSKKAPDFWSWRKGVFRFASRKKSTISSPEITPLRSTLEILGLSNLTDEDLLPLEDLQALIQQTEQQRGTKDPLLVTLYFRMGLIYTKRLERGEAQDYQAEQALAIQFFSKAADLQKELGLEEGLAASLNNLAYLYESQGRYEEAEPLFLQTLEVTKRLLGEDHLSVAVSLNNVALLYEAQGRYEEAEPLFLQTLEVTKRLLGEDHPDVAIGLNNLAYLYESQGRYEEAEPLYLQALKLKKCFLDEDYSHVASSLNNLAELYRTQGRYEEAEPLHQQSLLLRQRLLGKEHPDVATSLNNLALLYESQGDYSEAERLYLQALQIYRRLMGENHPYVAFSLNNLATLYSCQGRYSQAEPLHLQASTILEQSLGVNHPKTVAVRENLAVLRETIASQHQSSTSEAQS
jgi:tetratricopeptide (TPR) repeat protein